MSLSFGLSECLMLSSALVTAVNCYWTNKGLLTPSRNSTRPSRLKRKSEPRLLPRAFPILVFAHVPIQAFLDFNAAYMLLQSVVSPYQLTLYANPGAPRIAKHPTPSAPGAPVNGRNWAFAFAAYLTVYFIYFFGVFIGYANCPPL